MTNRPSYLDLTGTSYNDVARPLQSPGNLAPPKAGEIAPALSPLDAFAMQSRLLARRFDEEAENGKRISRLPPLTIQNELARLPSYFRQADSGSSSAVEDSPLSPRSDGAQNTGLLLAVPKEDRPKSTYPTIHGAEPLTLQQKHQPALTGIGEESETPSQQRDTYFDMPRAQSPEQLETRIERPTPMTPSSLAMRRSPTSPQSGYALSINSLAMSPQREMHGLRPPRSPLPLQMRNSPTIRSVYDSSDDVDNLSIGGSIDSLPPYKASTNTSFSRSHSPAFPFHMPLPRSPSAASDASFSSAAPRPSFNFSRPLSAMSRPSTDQRAAQDALYRPTSRGPRTGTMDSTSTRPSLEVPSGQSTEDSLGMPVPNDVLKMPPNVATDDYAVHDEDGNAGQSYTYSKFTLPRGRAVDRQSIAPGDFMLKQFDWGADTASTRTSNESRDHSPGSVRSRAMSTKEYSPFPTLHAQRHSDGSTGSPTRRSLVHKKSASGPGSVAESAHFPHSAISVATTISTTSDASTIKAQMAMSPGAKIAPADISTEDHLQRGIELHEAGKLPQSTYHLRIAAKAGHPTAMLLFALACRHGWGMRPSQVDGVAWLQKAVDSAQLEIADDEDLVARGNNDPSTLTDRKTHKAQFALSVYELGMSYMNGWGVDRNRGLGLRCFEVAGNWGDPDALGEAAFCYVEGIGCKKDLKKAAALYREAEKRGMSMAGNSWIYKEKYMDNDKGRRSADRGRPSSAKGPVKEKKRDKSRTRSIFGRKKSFINEITPMPVN